jgi:hypothetical protein
MAGTPKRDGIEISRQFESPAVRDGYDPVARYSGDQFLLTSSNVD